jgi:sterol desaturase/sphingolipid hydroxylase (fatty acid hydroxylase superfamily)
MNFEDFVLSHEPTIRLGFFLGVFALVALWEVAAPRRALVVSKARRWASNLGLVVLNTVMLRLLFPLAAVGVAAFCVQNGWGLINHFRVPFVLAVPLAVIAMDFVIWLQHVMVHAVPALWRLHRVHHADLDYDVTTGARFHPVGDHPVHAHQVRHHPRAGPAGGGRGDLRGAAQRHRHVQPRQHPLPAGAWTGCCAGSS